jgi:predicted helicase
MNKARIYYHDIGDYLSRDEKLSIIKKLGSIENTPWQMLTPNEHNDWINHRNDKFAEFIPLAPEKKFDAKTESFFTTYAIGIATNRDAWVYNFSKQAIANNMRRMIDFYNEQRNDFAEAIKNNPDLNVEDFIDANPLKISWTRALKREVFKNIIHSYKHNDIRIGMYRPFQKQELYFDVPLLESPGISPVLFPNNKLENLVISITGTGGSKEFSPLILDCIPNLHVVENGQYFPLYWYEETKQEKTLFDSLAEPESGYYARRDAISDFILNQARKIYGNKATKEDIFYYVYALLHNPDYRTMYAADLKKMLPRIPLLDNSVDFWKYVRAGRELAERHLHYEDYAHEAAGVVVEISSPPAPLHIGEGCPTGRGEDNYEVTKMRFPSKDDKSHIVYNPYITVTNIPAEAYEYVVNGKSAIEWVMERYQITTHKESGIVNNPNDWAKEHDKPKYILDLLLSIIAVSVKTVEIVNRLPKVAFEVLND